MPRSEPRRGVDVGSGANLYPALSMLPLCDEIMLWEYGAENCKWLTAEVKHYSPQWDKYWQTLRVHPEYACLGTRDVRDRLAQTATVHKGSLFDLPANTFDVGTMFFVAESMSSEPKDCPNAIKSFIDSLKSDAPFAAAFMRNSSGYIVNDHQFPAFRIDENDIRDYLDGAVTDLELLTVDTKGQLADAAEQTGAASARRLRPGYEGMILALGHVK
jgi:hypothetical protein